MFKSKEFFVEKILEREKKTKASMLELGCGTASYVTPVLKKYPDLQYVGVEPNPYSVVRANEQIKGFPDARIVRQLGYGDVSEITPESIDIVFSISALEHVKHLDAFLKTSVRYAKPGGLIVHRYDLGHALTPSSLKERLHVFLGDHFPQVLPESKFVRYVGIKEVTESLRAHGAHIERVTYHQMPSHKMFEKYTKDDVFNSVRKKLCEWEFDVSPLLETIPVATRERLFPSVAVWARKDFAVV